MSPFFFESMFNTALAGINAGGTVSAIKATAMAVILATALFAVYEAFSRGGDTRALGVAGLKYLVMGFALTHYEETFQTIYRGVTDVAHTIAVTDVWDNFRAQFQNYLQVTTSSFWNLVLGAPAGAISLVFQFIAMIIFPISCALFSFFYSLYGAVLYAVGPLVLALYPAMGVGQIARSFLMNLFVFFGWGIIYAVFCRVMTAVNVDSLTSIVNAGNFGSFFEGSAQGLLLAVSSIMYSLMILLIPFIANRVVSGDVGSTMMAVAGTAVAAATMLGNAVLGLAGGSTMNNSSGSSRADSTGGSGEGPASGGRGPNGGAGGGGGGGGTSLASSGSAPPRSEGGGGVPAVFSPANAREWGNYSGWANLSPEATDHSLGAMKQAPADLQGQPMWRVGSPAEVRQMAESKDWSQGYSNVAEAAATARSGRSGSGATRSPGSRLVGTYAGDYRVGRNWSHAAGWMVGQALSSGFGRVRSSFVQQQDSKDREG